MKVLLSGLSALSVSALPAMAASGPFFSLNNTNFVVTIAFVLFVALLVYLKVPGLIGGMLDKRADRIREELDEARALREEAQTILASYEQKQKEAAEQSEAIVAHAKEEARVAAEQAKEDIRANIARRLKAAEDQISSAEQAALREVKDKAVSVAVAAAAKVIAERTSAADADARIDAAIKEVGAKLH